MAVDAHGPQPMTIIASLSTTGCGTGECSTVDCYADCASGTFTPPASGIYWLWAENRLTKAVGMGKVLLLK